MSDTPAPPGATEDELESELEELKSQELALNADEKLSMTVGIEFRAVEDLMV